MMSRKNLARVSASVIVLVWSAASQARAESLSDTVALAYLNNPNLQAQRSALDALNETYVQARSAYGLQAQAGVTGTYEQVKGHYFSSTTNPSGQMDARNGSATLSLSQSLYSGGRNHAAVSVAEATIMQQREIVRQTETQVLQQAVAAYVAVRRDIASLRVYQDNVTALERQLAQIRAEYSVRQVTQTDVDETLGRVALARTNAANARAQLEISRSQYLQTVGRSPEDLAPEPSIEVFPTLDVAFDTAEAENPSLGAARYAEQVTRFRVAAARANFLPNVVAQVQVAQSPVEPYSSVLGNQTAVIGEVTLTQPLYESGLYASQVRQALAQQNEAQSQVEVTRRTAIQLLSQAWSQLVAARTALVADETGLKATQGAFYGVRREQPFDLRQPIDVLNAEQEFNNAQVRLLQDRYNEYVARINVLAAAGMLDAHLLSPGTPTIRPETHFKKVKNRGLPPWVGALQAIDSIGAPAPGPARPAVHDGDVQGRSGQALPPPPPAADSLKPMPTATEVMAAEAESNDHAVAPVVRPALTSPLCTHAAAAGQNGCPSPQP